MDAPVQRRDTATFGAAPGPTRRELRAIVGQLAPDQRRHVLEALTAAESAATKGGLMPLAAVKSLTSDELRPIRQYDPAVRDALDEVAATMLRRR